MREHYKTVSAAALAYVLIAFPAEAQDATTSSPVVVQGNELPTAYGAPPAFSRSRFSPTVTAYVLPPGSFLAATIYEGDALRGFKPDHRMTQEIEVGLPYRFNVAMETELQAFAGTVQATSVSLEARWALADWNKIPLNPTLFGEYKFGVGDILHDERVPEGGDNGGGDTGDASAMKLQLARLGKSLSHHATTAEGDQPPTDIGEEQAGRPHLPDAVEGRLLLAQDFFNEHLEWATNGFCEQEVGGDRGRELGFAQSFVTPLTRNESFKVGVEMQFRSFTDKDTRADPQNSFVIGPTIAWKPTRWSRLDVSPLFGTNDVSPHAQVFVVFSMVFGGGGEGMEAEAPASTRNR